MFFRETLFNREWNRRCFNRFIQHRETIRCLDLREVKPLGPAHDVRDYVGRVGFFTEDMFYIDIPRLTWYVRRDGNIWAEWNVVVPYGNPDYNGLRGLSWVDDRNHPKDDMKFSVPMSRDVKYTVNEYTRELWTMHKLGSQTLI